jgi:hypothetical protein
MAAAAALAIGVAVLVQRPWSGGPNVNHRQAAAQAAARAEAGRLLGLVTPPPGAMPVLLAPSPDLRGRVEGGPLAAAQIVATRNWSVPLPMAEVLAWLDAHPPRGLGSGAYTAARMVRGVPIEAARYTYEAPDSPAWSNAEVRIGVAWIGERASAVRVDGITAWLDPIPAPDGSAGPRMRVTVAEGCPQGDRGIVGVTNPPPSLTESLLPLGAPTGGLRCDYTGANRIEVDETTGIAKFSEHPYSLLAATSLDPATAAALAAKTSAIQLSHNESFYNCFGGEDNSSALVFSYPDRPDVDIWVSSARVPATSNGYIRTLGSPLFNG